MSTLKVNIGANIAGLEKALQTAQSRLNNFGQSLKRTGQTLSTRVTAPIAGLGGVVLKMASDAEETGAKFDAVFRDMAGATREWASQTAKATNRSRFAIEGYLATLQDTFVPMGVARDEAAGMSQEITKLAIDLASFNNMAEADVVNNLTSALVGNHEAVRRFGVVMTQATLDQELFNMGVEGGVSAASEQEKMLARMNIILKSTSDAQGDAERTSGSFANQMRGLRATLQEVAVVIGNTILPTATKFIEKISSILRTIADVNPKIIRMGVVIAGLVATIGPALFILGQLTIAIGAMLSPIGLAIAAIGGLVAAFLYARDNWEAIKERISDIGWWRNAIIDMVQFWLEWNPFKFIADGYVALLGLLGVEVKNPFVSVADGLEKLKVETGEYEHQFGTMKDAILNGISELTGIDFSNIFTGLSGAGGATGEIGIEAPTDKIIQDFAELDRIATQLADSDFSHRISENFSQMSERVNEETQLIRSAVRGMAEGFVEDLALIATGSQTMGGLTTNILRSLADLAVKMGKIILAAGLGIEKLKLSLSTFTGIGAIAAGAALIAIGTAAKSALSSAASGAVSGGGQGQFQRFASDIPSQGGTVEFKIGNDALVGVLQQGSVSSRRTGRTRSLDR